MLTLPVARYSPLLLNQIPAPRSGKDARWEAELPLSIVLHALTQDGNDQRQMMGARLIHLVKITLNFKS